MLRACVSGSETLTVEDTMMKRIVAMVVAFSAVIAMSGLRVAAHEGHDHKIMGTVAMAAVDHVMLRTRMGKTSRCRSPRTPR